MTFPSEGRLVRALGQFENALDRHLQAVALAEGDDSRIDDAVAWLLQTRASEGYWGYRSPAVTSLCLLAIAKWRPGLPSLQLLSTRQWLIDQSSGWMWETLWDTAVALTALHRSDLLTPVEARAATTRLTQVNLDECLPPAHHCAQVLQFLTATGADNSTRLTWVEATRTALSDNSGPYVTGQAIQALLMCGEEPDPMSIQLSKLEEHVNLTPLSTSSFLDHAAALGALSLDPRRGTTTAFAVDLLFGSAHRRDGSWYHEPWYTAWALLALHDVRHVQRYIVEQPRMVDYLAPLKKLPGELASVENASAIMEVRQRWRVAGYLVLLQIAVAGLLGSIFFLSEGNRWVSSGVLVTSLSAGFAIAWRGLWPLLKPPISTSTHDAQP